MTVLFLVNIWINFEKRLPKISLLADVLAMGSVEVSLCTFMISQPFSWETTPIVTHAPMERRVITPVWKGSNFNTSDD